MSPACDHNPCSAHFDDPDFWVDVPGYTHRISREKHPPPPEVKGMDAPGAVDFTMRDYRTATSEQLEAADQAAARWARKHLRQRPDS